MKKIITQILMFVLILFICHNINAQISITNNTGGTAGDFVGWSSAVTIPLEIRQDAIYSSGTVDPSIEFWVSGLKYLFIDGNSKNVGVGNGIPSTHHLNLQ